MITISDLDNVLCNGSVCFCIVFCVHDNDKIMFVYYVQCSFTIIDVVDLVQTLQQTDSTMSVLPEEQSRLCLALAD